MLAKFSSDHLKIWNIIHFSCTRTITGCYWPYDYVAVFVHNGSKSSLWQVVDTRIIFLKRPTIATASAVPGMLAKIYGRSGTYILTTVLSQCKYRQLSGKNITDFQHFVYCNIPTINTGGEVMLCWESYLKICLMVAELSRKYWMFLKKLDVRPYSQDLQRIREPDFQRRLKTKRWIRKNEPKTVLLMHFQFGA